MASVFYGLINTNFRMETTKEDCKQISAEENNFDSFDRAIRYTFNRPLLESEYQFIHKIIDDAMDKYAQAQVKNCAIADVSQQRELLAAFQRDYNKRNFEDSQIADQDIELFLAANCA